MRTRDLTRRETSYMSAIAAATSQLEELGYRYVHGEADGEQPVFLAYTPVARTNPYQALLYTSALKHGVATLPVTDWRRLPELPWPGRLVCHVHWVANVIGRSQTTAEADDQIEAFASMIDRLKADGRRIVWTAHNVLPHDTPWPEKDLELRRVLVDTADAVHVMSRGSIDALERIVRLPMEKVFFVPHPSYTGAYPDFVHRAEARSEFGLSENDFVFLLFGALARYKGIEELIAAFERLADAELPRRVRLIIGGQAADDELAANLRLWADGRDDAYVSPAKIPVEDVQYFYRAADLAVLPYRQVLNSGAAMLALSFGVPVLSAAQDGLRDVVEGFNGLVYDPQRSDGLHEAMRDAVTADLRQRRDEIRRTLPSFSAPAVSDAFFEGLLGKLGWGPKSRELVVASAAPGPRV